MKAKTCLRRLSVLVVLAGGVLAGCEPAADPSAKTMELPPVAVTVTPLEVRTLQRSVSAVGTLNAFDDVTLAPQVDGRVVAIHAEVGDMVLPGSVLLEIDKTEYVLAVTETRLALAAELAKLGLAELPPGEVDLEAVPSVRRSAVAQEDAMRRFMMKKELFTKQAASRDEFDLAETDLRLAQATKTQTDVEARAVLATARLRQASLALAEERLRNCQLKAPVPSGTGTKNASTTPIRYFVAQRLLGEGEMVRANPVTNAYRLVVDHVLKLRAAVPERYEPEVQVGQECFVTVDAYPGVKFQGRVARKYPTIDPLNRTFQAEIEVPNPEQKLKVGGFAKVAIQTRLDNTVKTVPPQAIVSFAGVDKVFLVEGETARAVEVRIGMRERDWVEVMGEIPPGTSVITSGQTQLVDGSTIRIRE